MDKMRTKNQWKKVYRNLLSRKVGVLAELGTTNEIDNVLNDIKALHIAERSYTIDKVRTDKLYEFIKSL